MREPSATLELSEDINRRSLPVDPEIKKKQELIKFLKGCDYHQTNIYWEEQRQKIENSYKLDKLEKIVDDKWKNVKPTWRNTKVPEKILFFELIDKEQQKLTN